MADQQQQHQQQQQQQQQPIAAGAPAKPSPINPDDVAHWSAAFNEVLAKPSETFKSKSPAGAQPWYNSFFNFFSPIETCFLSWCCPCVVFGRTHHRLHRNADLQGWEPVNASCLMMWASGCVCLHWLPVAMQRAEIRAKHNLQGDFLTDVALAFCCGCCSIVQADKEAEHREKLLASNVQQQGYQAPAGMSYPGPGEGKAQ
ncbi:hypothetical protein VTJ83DRAFT_5356 [Remersonia thermophila]|uniref:Uncharacterized protein n=1 Tax=Remersonia thermophila TaxID=72144 RepID=A0ABR4D6L9_9PEZI